MKLQNLRKVVDTTLPEDHLIIHLMVKESNVNPKMMEDDPTPADHQRSIESFKKAAGSKSKASLKQLLTKIADGIEDRDGG